MPRKPYPASQARALLVGWIALRVPKAPSDAPITVSAALDFLKERGLPVHRGTLYKHGLHTLISDGAQRQREEGGGRRVDEERRAYDMQIASMRDELRRLEERNRSLLGEIAILVWNARRCGVTEEELRMPMPVPDRSVSRAGGRR